GCIGSPRRFATLGQHYLAPSDARQGGTMDRTITHPFRRIRASLPERRTSRSEFGRARMDARLTRRPAEGRFDDDARSGAIGSADAGPGEPMADHPYEPLLRRIADALERLSPAPGAKTDFDAAEAFV